MTDLPERTETPDRYTPISIRLPSALIATYKMVADEMGVSYQKLMRDTLSRLAPELVAELLKRQTKESGNG